jgi:hypothetical protein
MLHGMRYLTFLLLLAATPAWADSITWKASNQVFSVSRSAEFFWPGLVPGTPWSLTVTFDPSQAPAQVITPGCNRYSAGVSTLTLGSFTYTHTSGSIYTNAGLPEVGCIGFLPEGQSGLIQFWYGMNGWVADSPDAWNLRLADIMYAGYYDLLVKDGTLPRVPTIDPSPGRYWGMEIESAFSSVGLFGGRADFQLVDQPATVPEPATVTMLGIGLASLVAAKRRRQ